MEPLKTNNFLADDLEIEAKRIKCDQAIKRVLANMSILARTVKGTVTEVRNIELYPLCWTPEMNGIIHS